MKTYEDYCKEYENIVSEGIDKGHDMAVQLDIYIAIHFLEDNNIGEPWAKDTPIKLKHSLDKCSPVDQQRFLSAIETTLETMKGAGE